MSQMGSAGAAIYGAVPHTSKGRGHVQACAVASKPCALQQLKVVLPLFFLPWSDPIVVSHVRGRGEGQGEEKGTPSAGRASIGGDHRRSGVQVTWRVQGAQARGAQQLRNCLKLKRNWRWVAWLGSTIPVSPIPPTWVWKHMGNYTYT